MRFDHHFGHRGRGGHERGHWGERMAMPPHFGGGWGRGMHGGHGHRGGRRRVFDGGELRLVLLKLIAEEPRHGYDLIRAIEERTGGAYAPSPGVVYPTLTMLGDMGLVEEKEGAGARRTFFATEAGSAHLAERADEVSALFARLDALGRLESKTGSGPVSRALANLHMAVRERASRDEQDAVVHAIADILDEATRRIERL